jgi:hypothetical protein
MAGAATNQALSSRLRLLRRRMRIMGHLQRQTCVRVQEGNLFWCRRRREKLRFGTFNFRNC